MIEITVSCKDDERSMSHRFLIHNEGLSLSHDDPELSRCVNEAIKKFGDEPSDIIIKFKYTW